MHVHRIWGRGRCAPLRRQLAHDADRARPLRRQLGLLRRELRLELGAGARPPAVGRALRRAFRRRALGGGGRRPRLVRGGAQRRGRLHRGSSITADGSAATHGRGEHRAQLLDLGAAVAQAERVRHGRHARRRHSGWVAASAAEYCTAERWMASPSESAAATQVSSILVVAQSTAGLQMLGGVDTHVCVCHPLGLGLGYGGG